MSRNFPIFHSHIDLAHHYWEKLLQKGDWAIDATCGNGHDTAKLAEILLEKQGRVIGIDVQQDAISRTTDLLQSRFSHKARARIHLFCQSHTHFPLLVEKKPIRLIVYNLGYLPKGNKQMTTMAQSTLESVRKALDLVIPGGALSIACYPGHEEGGKEEKSLLQEISNLSPTTWKVCYHTFPNHLLAPSLLLIQKDQRAIEIRDNPFNI
jgi:SAM-dependent methyltransferase